MTPTVIAGCMDCPAQTTHRTITDADTALENHSFANPGHRALVSTVANGWHRRFGKWLS